MTGPPSEDEFNKEVNRSIGCFLWGLLWGLVSVLAIALYVLFVSCADVGTGCLSWG